MKDELFLTGNVVEDIDSKTGDIICEDTEINLSELLVDERFLNKRVKLHIEVIVDEN